MNYYPPESTAWVLEHDERGNGVVRQQYSAQSGIGLETREERRIQELETALRVLRHRLYLFDPKGPHDKACYLNGLIEYVTNVLRDFYHPLPEPVQQPASSRTTEGV